jgi:hypothetical protein
MAPLGSATVPDKVGCGEELDVEGFAAKLPAGTRAESKRTKGKERMR